MTYEIWFWYVLHDFHISDIDKIDVCDIYLQDKMQASNLFHFDMMYLSSKPVFAKHQTCNTVNVYPGKLGVPFHAMNLKLSAAVLPQLYVTVGSQHMPLILGKGQKECPNSLFWWRFFGFSKSKMAIIVLGDLFCDAKMWWVGLSFWAVQWAHGSKV